MMTVEMVLADEVVAAVIRDRMQEARRYALEREACRMQPRRPSRLRHLLRFPLPWARRAGPAARAPSAA